MSRAKTQKPVVEDRRFQMNEKLLIDTIKRQAGTLAKAILEGVMNAVDAKATECRIALSETDLEVVDNGKGMSADEVRRLFEVFGAPHTPEEGKVYGTFRMGRGQLTDGERSRLIAQFVTGEMKWWDFCRLKVLELVNGKCTTPNVVFTTGRTITWCKARDPIGDKLQQDGIAQVLCESVLSDFGVDSLEELVVKCDLPHYAKFTIAQFEDLAKALRSDHKLLAVKDYCPNELVWLRLMEKCGHEIVSIVKQFSDVACKERQYMIGSSLSLAGWTNGCSWIAIAREWLMKQPFNVQGFGNVGALLLHEYIHGAPDSETHVHSPEFYEDYHNASKAISRFAYCCLSYFPQIMQSEGRKVSKRALRNLDSVAKADAALAKFGKVATAKAE